MAIDVFSSAECLPLPVKALTPAGIPNIINLNFEIGNVGTTTAFDVTLIKTLIVPAGLVLTVLDNGGSIINPPGTVFTAGPNSFIFPNLFLFSNLGSSPISLLGFTVTLQVTAGIAPATITEITQVIAPGDANPGNNTSICEISLW